MAIIKKITHGFVAQRFDAETGRCLGQEFTCGDDCTYETEDGEMIDEPDNMEYQPYHMTVVDNPPEIHGTFMQAFDGAIRRYVRGRCEEIRRSGDKGYDEWKALFSD